jgi:hypothetical protein
MGIHFIDFLLNPVLNYFGGMNCFHHFFAFPSLHLVLCNFALDSLVWGFSYPFSFPWFHFCVVIVFFLLTVFKVPLFCFKVIHRLQNTILWKSIYLNLFKCWNLNEVKPYIWRKALAIGNAEKVGAESEWGIVPCRWRFAKHLGRVGQNL